jgi:hypothetical protein
MEVQNPNLIVIPYKKVIDAFKKRYDVQNGRALGYREGQTLEGELKFENWPKSIGFGLATTGFCVSASQALLFDKIFQILLQDRGAMAKIVSIDIKEQYYGQVYNGSQNKWHTAILVKDGGQNFIIDITCFQFGNAFANKDIWDFETWEKTFRSSSDKHTIVDFEENILNFLPVNEVKKTNDFDLMRIINDLHSITTITDDERKILANFFTKDIDTLNSKLILGNINKFDFKYLDKINKLIQNLHFKQTEKLYSVMKFASKDGALNFIKNFIKNDCILQQFLLLSTSIDASCEYFNISNTDLNNEDMKNDTYVVFEFSNTKGLEVNFISDNISMVIPYGIKLTVDLEKDIFNGGKLLGFSVANIEKKTNTIYVNCSN